LATKSLLIVAQSVFNPLFKQIVNSVCLRLADNSLRGKSGKSGWPLPPEAAPEIPDYPLRWLSNGKHSTYCRSLRCCRFFLNTFLTRSRRKAARSTERVVPLFLAGPAAESCSIVVATPDSCWGFFCCGCRVGCPFFYFFLLLLFRLFCL